VEASAIPGSVGLARPRIGLGIPLLRLRSDEQLVSLFRGGNDDAFRVIHDRYRQRLHAYSRQMLAGSVADAEDVVQEIFVRAYGGLRSSDRELALRAWLYRIAHNRCIDEVRRPQPIATEAIEELTATPAPDPMAHMEQRDALRRLIADVRRLPEQQRSALLMRELGGMPYADVALALAVSVPAVKSLLVRARVGLAQAGEARDTSCARIREDVMVSHDRGVRTSGLARRHIRDCPDCRRFRSEVRGVSRQFAALLPALGPIGVVAKLLGVGGASGGGAAAGTGAVASTSGAAAGAGTGAVVSVGAVATGAGHVVTLIAAAVVTAGGAIELQRISPVAVTHVQHHHVVRAGPASTSPRSSRAQILGSTTAGAAAASAGSDETPAAAATAPTPRPQMTASAQSSSSGSTSSTPTTAHTRRHPLPISEVIDPDNLNSDPAAGNPTTTTTPTATTPSTTTPGNPPATGTTPTGAPTTTSPTVPTGTTPTGTITVPSSGTLPPSTPPPSTGSTDGSGSTQPPTALTPLTQTSKTSGTNGSKGGVALGATGASTRPGSVRVYKSTHR
jgi:RNA polymerase sigma factor (sigma-70 family)